MNRKLFITEIRHLIPELEKTELFKMDAKILLTELHKFEMSNEDVDLKTFDFESIFSTILNCADVFEMYNKLTNSVAVLYCSIMIINWGIVNYTQCWFMQEFDNSDINIVANIVANSITYDTNEFIISDEYLESCLCCFCA